MAHCELIAKRRAARAALRLPLLLLCVAVAAQAAANERYRVAKLPDGQPDLQGSWDHLNPTPLERMPQFNSLVITQAQAKQIDAALQAAFEDRTIPTEPTEYFNERKVTPIRGEFRSSIITEPADGKLPWKPTLADWPVKTRRGILGAMDGPEQRPNSERCLGNPASQPPHLNNPGTNLHEIIQTKDAVVFLSEWNHEARIIRLNAKHAPPAVTSWSGDSIGWWEGDTLVVETTNFSPTDTGRVAQPNAFLLSPQAKVVERFTRVSHDELSYVFSVEDAQCYTQIWKGETHFARTDDRVLEYSCHEGNSSLVYILQGARIAEQAGSPP